MRCAAATWRPRPRALPSSPESTEPDPEALARERLESFVAGLPLGGADATAVLEPAAADLFEAFAAAGVDVLLLKGAALARSLYTEPGERRTYSDIDLLVAPAHAGQAEAVLHARGYRSSKDRLGIDDVGQGVAHADTWLSPADARPHELDVHRRLPGTEAAPETAWQAFWEARETIELAGCAVPVPSRSAQALQLATHAAQHGPGYFKGLRELRMAMERWPLEVWQEAAALAGRVDAVAPLAAGLRLTPEGTLLAEQLGLPVDSALEWEIAHAEERPRGTFHAEAFGEAETLRERLGVVRRALFPKRRWLAVQYPWAERGPLRTAAGYLLHLARVPIWAARAWWFRRRVQRGAERSD
jgi:Uncharacterised nucleotidyltransferase